jgi:hypothetical protein
VGPMHGMVEMRPRVAVGEHSGGSSVWFRHTGTSYRSANRRLQLADGYYRAGRVVGSCLRSASLSGYPRKMTRVSAYQYGWHSVQEGSSTPRTWDSSDRCSPTPSVPRSSVEAKTVANPSAPRRSQGPSAYWRTGRRSPVLHPDISSPHTPDLSGIPNSPGILLM